MAAPARKPSPSAERALAAREARLAEMADQINDGSLVVRQMTAAERKRFERNRAANPPKPRSRPR